LLLDTRYPHEPDADVALQGYKDIGRFFTENIIAPESYAAYEETGNIPLRASLEDAAWWTVPLVPHGREATRPLWDEEYEFPESDDPLREVRESEGLAKFYIPPEYYMMEAAKADPAQYLMTTTLPLSAVGQGWIARAGKKLIDKMRPSKVEEALVKREPGKDLAEKEARAKDLGFTEDVYHWTQYNAESHKPVAVSIETEIFPQGIMMTRDQVSPKASSTSLASMVGIHVGDKESAVDRFIFVRRKWEPGVYERLYGPAPGRWTKKFLTSDPSRHHVDTKNLDPRDLKEGYGGVIVPLKARMTKAYVPSKSDYWNENMLEANMKRTASRLGYDWYKQPAESAKAVREFLLSKGFDHIPYYNAVEGQRGGVSYIVLDPNLSLRYKTADFKAKYGPLASSIFGGAYMEGILVENEDEPEE
jgi:hypothetical protein